MKRGTSDRGVWSAQTPDGEERPGAEYSPMEESTEQNPGGARLVPLVLCIILLAVLLIEGAFFWFQGQRMRRLNAVYVPDAQQTMQQADESFSFGPQQRMLNVSGQGEDLGVFRGAAQDEKLVRVAVRIGAMNEPAWDCNGAFYLQSDGVYYRNLGGYNLEEEHPEWAMRALNGYELCETGMEEGWVYFLVPQSVNEGTFWMHWLEKDEDYHNRAVQAAGVPVSFAQEVNGSD